MPKISDAQLEDMQELLHGVLFIYWIDHLVLDSGTFVRRISEFGFADVDQECFEDVREEVVDELVELFCLVGDDCWEVAQVVVEHRLDSNGFVAHVKDSTPRNGCRRATPKTGRLYDDSHLFGQRDGFSSDKSQSPVVI